MCYAINEWIYKDKYMKINLLLSSVIVMMTASSCFFSDEDNQEKDRYSFWKGDITNYYYILDMNDQRLHKVNGKPFMVLEYDPLTGVPLKCEFGLCEATNEYMPGMEGAIPEPFLSAETLEYAEKLGLTGSVSLLCSMYNEITTSEELSAGGFEFSVDKGSDPWGHEILHFSYTFDGMTGEIINDEVTWGGRVSEIQAFKMLRKFNDSRVD